MVSSAAGPGRAAPINSAANRFPSESGATDSAANAPTPAPAALRASKTGVANGAANAFSLDEEIAPSAADITRIPTGPFDGSKPKRPPKYFPP